MKDRPRVLAVDLDGTLLQNEGHPVFGEPIPAVVAAVRQLKEEGWVIVVWTCRGDTRELREYLAAQEIPFDHINENPGGPANGSPKIFADVYLDDRALRFDGDGDMVKKIKEAVVPWHEKMTRAKVAGFEDELAKIATGRKEVTYVQSRQGRRPISVATLLKKEREAGTLSRKTMQKLAEGDKKRIERTVESFAAVRPYARDAVLAAGRAGIAAKLLLDRPAVTRAGIAIGGVAGITNRALKDWAEANKRNSAAKKLLNRSE